VGLIIWDALSDEWTGLSLAITAGLVSAVIHCPTLAGLMTVFDFSHSRFTLPGRPGTHMYIPQEQGGPIIPPVTGFPFRRLLRLAEYGGDSLTRPHTGGVLLVLAIYRPSTTAQKTFLPLFHVLSLAGKSPKSCYLSSTVVLSPVYRFATWQWACTSHYYYYTFGLCPSPSLRTLFCLCSDISKK
jgi:hypothetical protein